MTKICDSCKRAVDESAFQCPACRSSSFDGANISKTYLHDQQKGKLNARIKTLEAAQTEMDEIPTQRSAPLFIAGIVLVLISFSLSTDLAKIFLFTVGALCLIGARLYSSISYQNWLTSRAQAKLKR